MVIRTLGTDTTDSEGYATITLPAHKLGKLQVYASFSDVYSERATIYDTIKYDIGTLAKHNDGIWSNISQFVRDGECTTIIYQSLMTITTDIDATDDYCIEFDFSGTFHNTHQIISLRNANNAIRAYVTKSLYGLTNDTWYHFIITTKDNKCTISCETHTEEDIDVSDVTKFVFRVSEDDTIKFKNFKVYSI